jgi:hypothetical protein
VFVAGTAAAQVMKKQNLRGGAQKKHKCDKTQLKNVAALLGPQPRRL